MSSRPTLRCEVGVTRDGDLDACGRPASGFLRPSAWEVAEFGAIDPYPACRFHLGCGMSRPARLGDDAAGAS